LSAHDDPLDPVERRLDLLDALLEVGAARHLAHEHAHEVGIAPPRTQQDLCDASQAVACALVGLLDGANSIEHVTPGLTEDRFEQLFLGAEVVVQQAVRNTCFFRDVTDTARVVALVGEHTHGRVQNQPTLVLLACR